MTRSEVSGQLWMGLLTVTFIKKDGTERTITGTQDPTRIPFFKQPKVIQEDKTEHQRSSCPIFDCTLEEWRSFCWDSVQKITTVDGKVWYDSSRDGGIL